MCSLRAAHRWTYYLTFTTPHPDVTLFIPRTAVYTATACCEPFSFCGVSFVASRRCLPRCTTYTIYFAVCFLGFRGPFCSTYLPTTFCTTTITTITTPVVVVDAFYLRAWSDLRGSAGLYTPTYLRAIHIYLARSAGWAPLPRRSVRVRLPRTDHSDWMGPNRRAVIRCLRTGGSPLPAADTAGIPVFHLPDFVACVTSHYLCFPFLAVPIVVLFYNLFF